MSCIDCSLVYLVKNHETLIVTELHGHHFMMKIMITLRHIHMVLGNHNNSFMSLDTQTQLGDMFFYLFLFSIDFSSLAEFCIFRLTFSMFSTKEQ